MRTLKTLYLIVLITVTVFVVGFFGARRLKFFRNMFSGNDIKKESVVVEPFKSIQMDAEVSDFTIIEGNEYRVDYEYPENISVKGKVENEVLIIEAKGKSNSGFSFLKFDKKGINTIDPKLTVTVPAGTQLDKTNLTINAGNINLSGRTLTDLDISCNAGNITLGNVTSDKVNIKTDAGNIEIKDSTLGDCDFSTSAGRIAVSDTTMQSVDGITNMGEINLKDITLGKGDLESNLGAVSVDGDFERLKVLTNMGKISVDSEHIENAELDLQMDLGDITVNGTSKGSSFKQN